VSSHSNFDQLPKISMECHPRRIERELISKARYQEAGKRKYKEVSAAQQGNKPPTFQL
jgi:hypothetical protein